MSCPVCNKPTKPEFKPFCSLRCKEVDLGRWFAGSYAVPAVENDDTPDDEMGEEE